MWSCLVTAPQCGAAAQLAALTGWTRGIPTQGKRKSARAIIYWDGAGYDSMRKSRESKKDDLRPAYDFGSMTGGVRGKYTKRLQKSSNVVLLERDVAAVFPNGAAVNEALRAVMRALKVVRKGPARPNKALHRAARARRR